jgi:hypothetical protein
MRMKGNLMASYYALRSRLNDEPKQKKHASWLDTLRRVMPRFRAPPIKPYTRMNAEELDRVSDI